MNLALVTLIPSGPSLDPLGSPLGPHLVIIILPLPFLDIIVIFKPLLDDADITTDDIIDLDDLGDVAGRTKKNYRFHNFPYCVAIFEPILSNFFLPKAQMSYLYLQKEKFAINNL